MLGDRENSWAMVGIAMDSDTRSIRLTMVKREDDREDPPAHIAGLGGAGQRCCRGIG